MENDIDFNNLKNGKILITSKKLEDNKINEYIKEIDLDDLKKKYKILRPIKDSKKFIEILNSLRKKNKLKQIFYCEKLIIQIGIIFHNLLGGEEEITFELACGDITKEELTKKIINEIMKEKRKKEKKEVENIDVTENQKKEKIEEKENIKVIEKNEEKENISTSDIEKIEEKENECKDKEQKIEKEEEQKENVSETENKKIEEKEKEEIIDISANNKIKEGILKIETEPEKWEEFWMVLTIDNLYAFKDKGIYRDPLFVLKTKDLRTVLSDGSNPQTNLVRNILFIFLIIQKLIVREGPIIFKANTNGEKESWIGSIGKAMIKSQNVSLTGYY